MKLNNKKIISTANEFLDSGLMINPFYPTSIMVVYSSDKNNDLFIETANIFREDKRPTGKETSRVSSFRPISLQEVMVLVNAVKDNIQSNTIKINYRGIIPENVLFFKDQLGDIKLVWHEPPTSKKMLFTKNSKIKSGMRPIPGLIYMVHNNNFFVFAYKGKNRPKEDTLLYQPPFFNCSNNGDVCEGTADSAKRDSVKIIDIIDYYNHIFWVSYFSHSGSANIKGGGITGFWKEGYKKHKVFPNEILLPYDRKKLIDIIDGTT